jgi:hypothetical protein
MRQTVVLPRRSLLLTIFLVSAIVAVSTRIYLFWQEGFGELPTVVKRDPPIAAAEAKPLSQPRPLVTTEVIIRGPGLGSGLHR